MSTWLPRALGAATAAYGTAVAVKPELLARPTGLTEDGRTPPGTVVLCRAVGVRDLISGVSIAAARSTPGLRGALAARVAARRRGCRGARCGAAGPGCAHQGGRGGAVLGNAVRAERSRAASPD